ncbi:hypothetical protein HELRODRAFT_181218 [Helobdella robusta]|uniref:Uncharacterized protein n=1 Tax=Helobdella robusta TaxID=6412 RepID=T1FGR4_HELRO|nr:hypothetical protein HELRODRAFT_181218 [Helobdella robusta]ESN93122.1 hypothetical protein HELRODRAFT_181218 [Helobdella robusta]
MGENVELQLVEKLKTLQMDKSTLRDSEAVLKAHLMLVGLDDISNMHYEEELAKTRNGESVKSLFKIKVAMAWLSEEIKVKYPKTSKYGDLNESTKGQHLGTNIGVIVKDIKVRIYNFKQISLTILMEHQVNLGTVEIVICCRHV